MRTEKNIQISNDKMVISENVLKFIAQNAALEVDGVHSIAKCSGVKKIIGSKGCSSPVQIQNTEQELIIDIYLNLKSTAQIMKVVSDTQHNIKNAIQDMTGKSVTKVNIHVMDIIFEQNGKQ